MERRWWGVQKRCEQDKGRRKKNGEIARQTSAKRIDGGMKQEKIAIKILFLGL